MQPHEKFCFILEKPLVLKDLSMKELSGLPLLHALVTAYEFEIAGSPNGPFAFSENNSRIVVFCEDSESVDVCTIPGAELAFMPIFERENAAFSCENGNVKCCIGDITAFGSTYSEAGLRALLKLKQHKGSKNEKKRKGKRRLKNASC